MSAQYLFRRNHIFYFRLRLPKLVRKRFKQSEIKISLHTGDRHLAHIRASSINVIVLPFLERAKHDEGITMSDLKDLLSGITTWTSVTLPSGLELKSEEDTPDEEREQLVKLMLDIAELDPDVFGKMTGLTPEVLAQYRPTPQTPQPPTSAHTNLTRKTVSQCFEDLKRENTDKRQAKWKAATVKDYQDTCTLYIDYLGEDKPFDQISLTEHLGFKDALQKLPANRSKKPAYRDHTVRDLLDMTIPETDLMSYDTINNHLTRLNALVSWLRDACKTTLPNIRKLRRGKNHNARDARAVFTSDEIRQLTSHRNYLKNAFLHDYYYWLIPLGLYTGARLRELCQLETQDIQCCPDSGIWYLSINEDLSPELASSGVVKSVKTSAGCRLIPIHSHLLELGFREFVDSKRRPGQSAFVFNITPDSDGDCSRTASKWFQRYRKTVVLDTSKGRKDFHSLRHTFIDTLDKYKVKLESNRDLSGHAQQGTNSSTYRKVEALRVLKDELEKLNYRPELSNVTPWTQIGKSS